MIILYYKQLMLLLMRQQVSPTYVALSDALNDVVSRSQ